MTINYKVFAAGDTLSANDLLTYIENQAVIQVDNEAELTTLNTTYPSVRVAFAQDTDKLYVNNDGVWDAVVSGVSPTLTNLTLTGNLTVQGTTTTIDSATIAVKDKFIFEGATADAHETTLQVAEPTADRTITLPDATGTVALTSGLYALPSQTGNSGKYLKTDGTNETWSIDATSDLITTAGDIVYGTAADTMTRLGIGTANQVLRVNSGATAPEWATASTGIKTVASIAKASVPAASSFSITGLTQDYYMLRLTDLKWGTANSDIIVRINGDSGSNYSFLVVTTATGDTYQYYDTTLGTFLGMSTVSNKRDANNHRVIEIHNGKGSGYHTYTMRGYHVDGGGTQRGVMAGGWHQDNAPITSISVHQADGYTFSSGTYELIGG